MKPHVLLKLEHITMRFGGLVAVDDVSFEVYKGQITAVIGPNGAGKTTLFNCITGFYRPTVGRLSLSHGDGSAFAHLEDMTNDGSQKWEDGDNKLFLLERMPNFRIASEARVARTFQNIRLFGGMTVLENLIVAQHNPLMRASGFTVGGLFGIGGYRKHEKQAVDRARYWLDRIGLLSKADDAAASLAYGDQRRLEIVRAMCTNPVLLCLDEPAAGLNGRESAALNELLFYIREEHKTSILLIEHDMSVVMNISDYIIVLDYGRKIARGTPDVVRNDPKVIAAYLGVDEASQAVTEVMQ